MSIFSVGMVKCIFFWSVIGLILSCKDSSSDLINSQIHFQCPPCNMKCDELLFYTDGICPNCKMNLIRQVDSSQVDQYTIQNGSGNFLVNGLTERDSTLITIFYHKPIAFDLSSEIVIVLPGAGRTAHEYRDAWVEASEKYNILVLSPSYSELEYDFGGYHMGGMIQDVSFDTDFVYTLNQDTAKWIFRDFDRLFLGVKESLQSIDTQYDIFGHSAGGQILHRMTLFYNSPYVNRIIASNSGWYTTTDNQLELPYGIKNTICDSNQLVKAFSKNLLLLIGEEDNHLETRGILLRTDNANQQGPHRLARAKSFFHSSQNQAKEMSETFNWELQIVPNVGHDSRLMSIEAAKYLFDIK